jgi:poly-gamma-glutamate capsule biosynthesis protein CapA/YwtB (metallophosphatase superfamily)
MQRLKDKFFLLIAIFIMLLAGFFSYVYFPKKVALTDAIGQSTAKTLVENQQPQSGKKDIKIIFLGDMMFDRYIREIAQKRGNDYLFEKINGLLKNADLAVANLEGPITDSPSASIGTTVGEKGHFIFTFDKSFCNTLASNNIKLVNIGNNHILNFGQNGLAQTKANLNSAGVGYFDDFGPASTRGDDSSTRGGENITHIANINDYKIGFVNYNQFSSGSLSRTLENISNLRKQTDALVVYTHWGTEYQTHSSENIRKLGHRFIDSGADLVIGSHPHVTQEKEEYKGHWIYYSLGNFIFDQYFSENTKKGLAVEVSISPERLFEFKDIPLILDNNGQTRANTL